MPKEWAGCRPFIYGECYIREWMRLGTVIYYDELHFEERSFLVAASEKGLVYVDIKTSDTTNLLAFFAKYDEAVDFCHDQQKLAPYTSQLGDYLRGERQVFELSLDFGKRGTPFQQAVWRELLKASFGESSSYSALAVAVGKPQAIRAVGTAVGKNPMPIVVPCHRILRKDGGIGGYAGGLSLKRRLLAIEGITLNET